MEEYARPIDICARYDAQNGMRPRAKSGVHASFIRAMSLAAALVSAKGRERRGGVWMTA